jgi:TPP-dependent indolepyruvate ferredoxin oxidoreductase alpha subunit
VLPIFLIFSIPFPKALVLDFLESVDEVLVAEEEY